MLTHPALQAVDWREVSQTVAMDDADDVPADADETIDAYINVAGQLCSKLRDGFAEVREPASARGSKCALSMLDIPRALAGAFDVGSWKAILTEAAELFRKISLIDFALLAGSNVLP